MKVLFTTILLIVTNCLFSQTEIVFQPDGKQGIDARIQSNIPNQNIPNSQFYSSQSGTMKGIPFIDRSLINFDLSFIPNDALIISASLSLFANTLNGGHTKTDGSNASVLELITEPWEENMVTWNNQPTTNSDFSINLPRSNGLAEDYLDIDVTRLIDFIFDNPNSGYGFMIKLIDESGRRTLQFGSSDAVDQNLRPLLRVVFLEGNDCIELGSENLDARVQSNIPNQNISNSQFYSSQSGTMSGVPFIDRSLITFDLNQIPEEAILTHATLNLFAHTLNGGHTQTDGCNASTLELISEPWNPNTVTWNNQPPTNPNSSVTLDSSEREDQNYLTIDVSSQIESMRNNQGFGLMIKLLDESGRRTLQLASSDAPEPTLHPRLNVCFTTSATTSTDENILENAVHISPNPASTEIIINTTELEPNKAFLYNMQGQKIKELNINASNFKIDIHDVESGSYILSIHTNTHTISKKIVKI